MSKVGYLLGLPHRGCGKDQMKPYVESAPINSCTKERVHWLGGALKNDVIYWVRPMCSTGNSRYREPMVKVYTPGL